MKHFPFRANTFLTILLLCLVHAQEKRRRLVEIKCTTNCICDHFGGLRKATCSGKKMLSVKDNIPHRTEFLDFSYNYVTKLHGYDFHDSELGGLKILNISNNKIGEIDLFAFEPVKDLDILDLSHNALRYVLAEWFWEFTKLKEVHLECNNLGALPDVPLFNSPTIEILHLQSCHLPHLFASTFTEMPKLQELDISNNFLISIKTTVVSHLSNLHEIILQGNNIKCEDMSDFLTYLNEKSIEYKTDCMDVEDADVEIFSNVTSKKSDGKNAQQKFEKMMNWNADEKNNTGEVKETSWVFEDIITDQGVKEQECTKPKVHFLVRIVALAPEIVLTSVVTLGFSIGLLVGFACRCKCAKPVTRRKRVKSIHRVSRSFSFKGGQIHDREYLIE